MSNTDRAEEAPLLGHRDEQQQQQQDTGREIRDPALKLSVAARVCIAVASLTLLVAIELSDLIIDVPRTQIEESILCRKRYSDVVIGSNDPRCKDNSVQADLSMLQALELTCTILPSLLTAVPWGVVADKYGRIFVLRLSIFGLLLVQGSNIIICHFPDILPLKLIWVTPVFFVIGGGVSVVSAMIYTVASDICTEAQRTTAFFYVTAASLGTELLSKPVIYFTMERGVWFSMYIGYFFTAISLISLCIFPDILTRLIHFEIASELDELPEEPVVKAGAWDSIRQNVHSGINDIAESFHFLFWQNKILGLVLVSIMFGTLGRAASILLLQYISKRFGWSWSQANLLLSVRSFTSLGLTLVVLPIIGELLLRRVGLSPLMKDLWMARGSIILLITGALVMGIANLPTTFIAGMILFGMGSGFNVFARSLLATVAGGRHVAMLYTTVSFVEMSGILISGPVIATTFRYGLKLGGVWVGLPFLSAACLFCVAAVIILRVDFKHSDKVDHSAAYVPIVMTDEEEQ